MFVASNRLSIADGRAGEFEEFFRWNMRQSLPGVPGMLRSVLYRPTEKGQPYLSLNDFESEKAFRDWLASDSFRQSHERVRARNMSYLAVDGMKREHLLPIEHVVVEPAVVERPPTVFAATSRMAIKPGTAEEFEPFYREQMRDHLADVPGLLRSVLLKPARGDGHYIALEEFETEEIYRTWQESASFGQSHNPVRNRIRQYLTDYKREYFTPCEDLMLVPSA